MCDRDCFHCKYSDCINDSATDDELVAIETRDAKISAKAKTSTSTENIPRLKKIEQCKDYYRRHREERQKYQRQYYYRKKAQPQKCNRCAGDLPSGYAYVLCEQCRMKKRIYQRQVRETKDGHT